MTAEEVRKLFRDRKPEDKCHDACPGWCIDHTGGLMIQRCDECASYGGYPHLTDEDVAELPEAQAALRECERELEAMEDGETE